MIMNMFGQRKRAYRNREGAAKAAGRKGGRVGLACHKREDQGKGVYKDQQGEGDEKKKKKERRQRDLI